MDWEGEGQFQIGTILYRKYEHGINESNLYSSVNNIEHNIKQNISTAMEVMSLIPP